jgi:hypothetical protein
MARTKMLTGGCQCGAVRYAIPVPTTGVHLCHCRMCQRAVGNVFAALAPVPRASVTWTRGKPKQFKSSTAAQRGFCPKCGTPLTFGYVRGATTHFTIGSLDEPSAVTPEIHYGAESWVRWLKLADKKPREATNEAALASTYPGFKSFQTKATPSARARPRARGK